MSISYSEAHFYPLDFKIRSCFPLFFPLRTNVPDLLRLQEVTIIGEFLHQGTEYLGIFPGRAPHGRVVRIPWMYHHWVCLPHGLGQVQKGKSV